MIIITTLVSLLSLLYYISVLRYSNPVIQRTTEVYSITQRQMRILLAFIIFLTIGVIFINDIYLVIYIIFL